MHTWELGIAAIYFFYQEQENPAAAVSEHFCYQNLHISFPLWKSNYFTLRNQHLVFSFV